MLQRFKQSLARFMYGRYGPDELNTALLIFGAVLAVAGMLFSLPLLTVLSYAPLGWLLFRMFSRNLNRRRLENQKYLQFFARQKDRASRYYSCPRCRQTVRVPRGRGKINIHCPKCGNQFIKKT